MSEVKLIGSSFLCIKSASLIVQRQHAYISNGHLKIKADVGKQFQGALNRGPLKEKLQSLWGSSRHDFWSICSVISRNVIIISQQETHYEKSPIKKKKVLWFCFHHSSGFSLIFCFWSSLRTSIDPDSYWLRCHWSHMLLLIDSGHTGPTWRPVSTSGVSALLFRGDALAPQQGKGHTWKDRECLSDWGINSRSDCHVQRPHCLLSSLISKIWRV